MKRLADLTKQGSEGSDRLRWRFSLPPFAVFSGFSWVPFWGFSLGFISSQSVSQSVTVDPSVHMTLTFRGAPRSNMAMELNN